MSSFLYSGLSSLEAYTPGEQPTDKKYIKLNTNESPYPPPESVVSAAKEAAKSLERYPDPCCTALRTRLGETVGLLPENVFVTNGSDDILNLAFLGFGSGRGVAFPSISYGFYPVFARLYGLNCITPALCPDFCVDVGDFSGLNRLIVIANPNAPTGRYLEPSQIEHLLMSNPDSMVLVDEAYIDFGGKSCVELVKRYGNLLVVRTFSKSRSMAGARLGFAFGHMDIIADLERLKYSTNPYSVNSMTLAAALAALGESEYYHHNCKKIISTREQTVQEISALGFEVVPSMANFIFAASNRIPGAELYGRLRDCGILVRHFSDSRISNYNRITIGTDEQMAALIAAVSKITEVK